MLELGAGHALVAGVQGGADAAAAQHAGRALGRGQHGRLLLRALVPEDGDDDDLHRVFKKDLVTAQHAGRALGRRQHGRPPLGALVPVNGDDDDLVQG